jgi:CheY-like chemotaxis protein/MinD-like ATPase involved in chromosome partitioning or flagellar assembly
MAEKILIVDDDIETVRLVGLMLERQGYTIIAVNNGTQAIQMAQIENPDLILLDVMMPDLDGFQVTRQIRTNPQTHDIPIIMFTAKNQIEDKITGFDAGVDDYLTKPTHPAEMMAHIKALLMRSAKARGYTSANARGHVVAFLSAKGGVGTSTMALNVGVSIHQKTKMEVILAELRPGYGTWGLELGYVNPEGLKGLMQFQPDQITPELLKKELVANASGVRLLMSSYQPDEIDIINCTAQLEAIINQLSSLAPVVLVDLGTNQFPRIDTLLEQCNEAIIVVEPNPTSVACTKALMEDLERKSFGKAKSISLALVNRIRADVMLSWSQVQELLGTPISVIISPAPELAYQAALRFTPMVLLQPEGLTAQQYGKLAELISRQVKNSNLRAK